MVWLVTKSSLGTISLAFQVVCAYLDMKLFISCGENTIAALSSQIGIIFMNYSVVHPE